MKTQTKLPMTYLLSEQAKQITWKQFKAMGGCGLSGTSEAMVFRKLGALPARRYGWERFSNPPRESVTLGQIQDAHITAGREIARFFVTHLNRPQMATVEYVNP